MNAPLPEPPAARTTCPYCGVGCGLLARPDGYGGAEISGDPDHPANFGRICSKGAALGETLSLTERLLYPMLRQGDGRLARVDWHTALDRVAVATARAYRREGRTAIRQPQALLLSPGQRGSIEKIALATNSFSSLLVGSYIEFPDNATVVLKIFVHKLLKSVRRATDRLLPRFE